MAKAHVIPTSLYGNALKDPTGPAKIVTDKVGTHSRKTLTGIYDLNIVCQPCEARFDQWDNYANHLLMRTKPDEIIERNGVKRAYVYHDIKYDLLKLFFVSLLWRTHHASHDMFSGVDVGRKFEGHLRSMILECDPGHPETFAVVLARFDHELADGFFHPFRERYDGVNVYRISFSQHAAYVKVSSQKTAETFRSIVLSPDQPLTIIARDFESSKELKAMKEMV